MKRRALLAGAAGLVLGGCATGRPPTLRDPLAAQPSLGPVSRLFVVSFLPVFFDGPIGTSFRDGLKRSLGERLQAAGIVAEQHWMDRWTITQKHAIVQRSTVGENIGGWSSGTTHLPVREVLADLSPIERAFRPTHRLLCSRSKSVSPGTGVQEFELVWALQSVPDHREAIFHTDGALASAGEGAGYAAATAELVVRRLLRG